MRLLAALCLGMLLANTAGAESARAKVARLRALLSPASAVERPPARCARPPPGTAAEPQRLERAIRDAALRFRLDPDLIRAVISVESAWDAAALSHAGAMGLMQLMPATARGLGVVCPYDVRENVTGGARYLRSLRDELGSWPRALAGYHAGPARVRADRIPAITRRYIERVMERWRSRKP